MKCFNEQFRELLKEYPNDANCISALKFLEGVDKTTEVWSEDRVRKFLAGLRFELKKRNPYFGYLIDKINIKIVNPDNQTFRTMAVDQDHNLYINPEFTRRMVSGAEEAIWDKDVQDANATDPTLEDFNALPVGSKLFLGIIAHELLHIFKDHISRGHDKRQIVNMWNQQISLWNIATDIEINDELIYKWGYYMVKNGIITNPDGTYEFNGTMLPCRGKTPERIYRELLALIPTSPPSEKSEGGDDNEDDEPITVGDIIYDKKSNRYGEVVTIDSSGNAKIVELSEKEAKQKTKERG